jgi:hypothetical protein
MYLDITIYLDAEQKEIRNVYRKAKKILVIWDGVSIYNESTFS